MRRYPVVYAEVHIGKTRKEPDNAAASPPRDDAHCLCPDLKRAARNGECPTATSGTDKQCPSSHQRRESPMRRLLVRDRQRKDDVRRLHVIDVINFVFDVLDLRAQGHHVITVNEEEMVKNVRTHLVIRKLLFRRGISTCRVG
jgi:hypothetical protein